MCSVICLLPTLLSFLAHKCWNTTSDELERCVTASFVQTKQNGTAGVADELELSMALCLHEAVSSMHKC